MLQIRLLNELSKVLTSNDSWSVKLNSTSHVKRMSHTRAGEPFIKIQIKQMREEGWNFIGASDF